MRMPNDGIFVMLKFADLCAFRAERDSLCDNCMRGHHFRSCKKPSQCGCVCNEQDTRAEWREVQRHNIKAATARQ